jgi:hypothetical protein
MDVQVVDVMTHRRDVDACGTQRLERPRPLGDLDGDGTALALVERAEINRVSTRADEQVAQVRASVVAARNVHDRHQVINEEVAPRYVDVVRELLAQVTAHVATPKASPSFRRRAANLTNVRTPTRVNDDSSSMPISVLNTNVVFRTVSRRRRTDSAACLGPGPSGH